MLPKLAANQIELHQTNLDKSVPEQKPQTLKSDDAASVYWLTST